MTALIGADWGTTNLRAYRFDAAGTLLERRAAPRGISTIENGAFEPVLADLIGDWRAAAPGAPILLSGMIGSQQGWAEAPYLPCPADTADLARSLKRIDSGLGPVWIAPGLSVIHANGLHDVMRGEETEILGALDAHLPAVVITPGTHSKWVHVEGRRITGFRTFMSGELYAVLCAHSILGRLMAGRDPHPEAFRLGVRRALADPAILSLLFSARAEALFGVLPRDQIAAYLSGLLIGAEVGSALGGGEPAGAITIIGAEAIAGLYQAALTEAGLPAATVIDGAEAAPRGLFRIGAHLISESHS